MAVGVRTPVGGGTADWNGAALDPSGTVQETLHHLLEIEAQAQAMVNGAQAEGVNRIAEAEKRYRAGYEKRYAQRASELEADFLRQTETVHEAYQKELAAWQSELDALRLDTAAFNRALERFLTGES